MTRSINFLLCSCEQGREKSEIRDTLSGIFFFILISSLQPFFVSRLSDCVFRERERGEKKKYIDVEWLNGYMRELQN
jgi:hypothetical protein